MFRAEGKRSSLRSVVEITTKARVFSGTRRNPSTRGLVRREARDCITMRRWHFVHSRDVCEFAETATSRSDVGPAKTSRRGRPPPNTAGVAKRAVGLTFREYTCSRLRKSTASPWLLRCEKRRMKGDSSRSSGHFFEKRPPFVATNARFIPMTRLMAIIVWMRRRRAKGDR